MLAYWIAMNIKMYFCRRFSLAFSVMTMGRAAGMIALPILAERLMENFGWRGAFLVLAAINFNVLVSAVLNRTKCNKESSANPKDRPQLQSSTRERTDVLPRYRNECNRTLTMSKKLQGITVSDAANIATSHNQLASSGNTRQTYGANERIEMHELVHVRESPEEQEEASGSKDCPESRNIGKLPFPFSWPSENVSRLHIMFKDYPAVALLSVTYLFLGISMSGVIIFLVPNATEKGVELSHATLLSSIFGFGDMIGRPLTSLFHTKTQCNAIKLSICLTVTCAGTLLVYPFLNAYVVLAVVAFTNGLTIGSLGMLSVTALNEVLPNELFKHGMGLNYLCFGVGNPLGGFLAGNNKSTQHSLACKQRSNLQGMVRGDRLNVQVVHLPV